MRKESITLAFANCWCKQRGAGKGSKHVRKGWAGDCGQFSNALVAAGSIPALPLVWGWRHEGAGGHHSMPPSFWLKATSEVGLGEVGESVELGTDEVAHSAPHDGVRETDYLPGLAPADAADATENLLQANAGVVG